MPCPNRRVHTSLEEVLDVREAQHDQLRDELLSTLRKTKKELEEAQEQNKHLTESLEQQLQNNERIQRRTEMKVQTDLQQMKVQTDLQQSLQQSRICNEAVAQMPSNNPNCNAHAERGAATVNVAEEVSPAPSDKADVPPSEVQDRSEVGARPEADAEVNVEVNETAQFKAEAAKARDRGEGIT